jgi:hypothetical protein
VITLEVAANVALQHHHRQGKLLKPLAKADVEGRGVHVHGLVFLAFLAGNADCDAETSSQNKAHAVEASTQTPKMHVTQHAEP